MKKYYRLNYQKYLLQLLFIFALLLAVLIVYQNNFFRVQKYNIKSFSDEFLSIDITNKNNFLRVKITIPYSNINKGCEFNYGQIRVKDNKKLKPNQIKFEYDNYLVRFKYDSKNSRCESKDFSISLSQLPAKINLKMFSIEHLKNSIIESEFDNTYNIAIPSQELINTINITKTQNKQKISTRSIKEINFSTNLDDNEVVLKFAPWESFGTIAKNQLNLEIQNCLNKKICRDIKYAISTISDPEFYDLLETSEKVGLKVEGILNANSEINSFKNYHKYTFANSPLLWLRGDKNFDDYKGILQMHTKFIIFGDDLVISSNQNLDKYGYEGSRGLTVEYKTHKVVPMFKTIFQIIKTGVPFPVFIDSKDNFQLLFNHYRPRSYIASAFKNYTPIVVDKKITTNAYGIILNEIKNSDNHIQVFNSPISDGCYNFDGLLCFFEILKNKSKDNLLTLGLSGTFYLQHNQDKSLSFNSSIHSLKTSRFDKFLPILELNSNSIKLYKEKFSNYTSHHERYAVIKDSMLVAGSANFVYKNSVNTLEVLKNIKIVYEAQNEINTFDEPYIAFPSILNGANSYQRYKDCLFRIEADMLSNKEYKKHYLTENQISEIKENFTSNSFESELLVIEPDIESNEPNKYLFKDLTKKIEVLASRICVWNKSNDTSRIIDIRNYN